MTLKLIIDLKLSVKCFCSHAVFRASSTLDDRNERNFAMQTFHNMLIAESAHLSHLVVFDQEIGAIPKGYLYFTIAFSIFIEFLNMRYRKKTSDIVTTVELDEEDEEYTIFSSIIRSAPSSMTRC